MVLSVSTQFSPFVLPSPGVCEFSHLVVSQKLGWKLVDRQYLRNPEDKFVDFLDDSGACVILFLLGIWVVLINFVHNPSLLSEIFRLKIVSYHSGHIFFTLIHAVLLFFAHIFCCYFPWVTSGLLVSSAWSVFQKPLWG